MNFFVRVIRGKLSKHIIFPIENLDMSPYILQKLSNSYKYNLFAVIVIPLLFFISLETYWNFKWWTLYFF